MVGAAECLQQGLPLLVLEDLQDRFDRRQPWRCWRCMPDGHPGQRGEHLLADFVQHVCVDLAQVSHPAEDRSLQTGRQPAKRLGGASRRQVAEDHAGRLRVLTVAESCEVLGGELMQELGESGSGFRGSRVGGGFRKILFEPFLVIAPSQPFNQRGIDLHRVLDLVRHAFLDLQELVGDPLGFFAFYGLQLGEHERTWSAREGDS